MADFANMGKITFSITASRLVNQQTITLYPVKE